MPSEPVAVSPLKDSPGPLPENADTDAPLAPARPPRARAAAEHRAERGPRQQLATAHRARRARVPRPCRPVRSAGSARCCGRQGGMGPGAVERQAVPAHREVRARSARRLQPRRHRRHRVRRRRPAEPRQPVLLQRVGVLAHPPRLAVGDARARGVRQRQLEQLLALVVRVVEDRDRDRLLPLPRREGERAARRRVVLARPRRDVPRRIVHRHLARRPAAQRDPERDGGVAPLERRAVLHLKRRRAGYRQLERAPELAPVRRAHRALRRAVRRRRQGQRHRTVGLRPDSQLPQVAALVHPPRARHLGAVQPQRRQHLLGARRHRRAERDAHLETLPAVVLGRSRRHVRRQRPRGIPVSPGRWAEDPLLPVVLTDTLAFCVGAMST